MDFQFNRYQLRWKIKCTLVLGNKFNLSSNNNEISTDHIVANFKPKIEICGKNSILNLGTKQFLEEHPELFVIDADKDNVTVLMNNIDIIG